MKKYSMIKKANGRRFRYNYQTDNLECVVRYQGKWIVSEMIGVSRNDWKRKYSRNAIIDDFCEMIADHEFSEKYNIIVA